MLCEIKPLNNSKIKYIYMKLHNKKAFLSFALAIFAASTTFAQEQEPPETTVAVAVPVTVDKGPEDALNRGTPRRSIVGFLKATSEFNFEKAAEYLDLRNLPDEASEVGGPELARQLNQVISRSVWLDDYSVSDSPEGAKGDGLPGYRDELMKIKSRNGEVPIWMQRVPRGDGEQIWKVSNRSVALIPELYEEFSYSAPIEQVRNWFPEDASFLGLEAFKWLILLIFAVVSWPIFYAIGSLLSRIFSSPEKEIYPLVRKVFTGPLTFIAVLVTVSVALSQLGAGAYAQQVMSAQTLSTVALVWALWAIINLFKKYKQNRLIEQERPGAAKLLQPMTTLIKLMIVMFGLLFWLNNIGFNITTVLAGLGVGGLAVALALQKPIEDMMGALTIFSQAPIRVGDLCKYGGVTGTVEDIGLRTTRVRTLTNTVVSIPNSRIAYVEVENLSYREKIRYWPTLRLRYDTRQSQLRQICDEILLMLQESDQVHDDPVRVRFTDFDEDAVLIKVHCFLKTTDFAESLKIGEELNYGIMRIVEGAGAQFALPGSTIYIEGESPSPQA
jgi:MscS family membrane protein